MQLTVDYAIVGGGESGLVITLKLLEKGYKVALIENGFGHHLYEIKTPSLYPFLWSTEWDWNHTLKLHTSHKNVQINIHSAKCIGGKSILAPPIYTREIADNIKTKLSSNKLATLIEEIEGDTNGHLISPRENKAPHELSLEFADGKKEHNLLPETSILATTITGGKRVTLADTVFKKIINADNFCPIYEGYVEEIELVENAARGIRFTKYNKQATVNTKKGVIIAAGAIESQRILLRSGIGPPEVLQQWNKHKKIETRAISSSIKTRIFAPALLINPKVDTLDNRGTLRDRILYRLFKKGPLVSPLIESMRIENDTLLFFAPLNLLGSKKALTVLSTPADTIITCNVAEKILLSEISETEEKRFTDSHTLASEIVLKIAKGEKVERVPYFSGSWITWGGISTTDRFTIPECENLYVIGSSVLEGNFIATTTLSCIISALLLAEMLE